MTIDEAPLHRKLVIAPISDRPVQDISDVESRLMHLGFIEGAKIEIKLKAPIFHEPFLVEVRGRMVALSKSEAQMVRVEVCS